MEKRRQPEVIAGRVNADGTIAAGDGFSVVKNGTGSWTLTFAGGFRLISVTHIIGADAVAVPVQSAITTNTVTLKLYNTAAAALDQPFNFIAVGIQQ